MKTRHRKLWLGLLAMASFASGTVWASINSAAPPAKTVGPVTYIDGGRAPAQAQAMNREASDYPLELLFLWGRGQKETPIYGVQWSIKNAAGHELLDKSAGGPEVLASLPNGRYTVTAHYQEKTLSRAVTVHRGQHDEVVLEWAS